ncbi:MAG: insulinase family protein [Ignavibacteria bacterium]|nr:insulinase family protein [Ignavibacteria bacterium]
MKRKNNSFRPKERIIPIEKVSYEETLLDNGVLVITEKVPYFNSFAFGIGIRVGSRRDFPGYEGIAHFIEHLLFRRTKNLSSTQINELFESYGAYFNAFTTKEYTVFYVRALRTNFKRVWKLLFDIVFQRNFIKQDIDKERSIIFEEIRSTKEDPEEEILDYTDKIQFQNTDLAHPIVGSVSSVKRITLKEIEEFYSKFFGANNIVVSVVGNFEHSEILDEIGSQFSSLQRNNEEFPNNSIVFSKVPKFKKLRRQFLQSHLTISTKLPRLNQTERYISAIANILIADCASSRLYKKLREETGLVYNVSSSFSTFSDCSAIYIYSTMNPNKQNKSIELISQEIENIAKNGFTQKEMELSKEQIKSSTIIAFENLSERLQAIMKAELTFGKYEPLSETISVVNSIELEELNRFVRNHFSLENWTTILFEAK